MSSDPDQRKLVTTLQRWKPWLIGAAVLVITLLLVHTLRDLLLEFSYGDLLDAIRGTSGSAIGLALLATLVSFLALTGYDASSLRYVGAPVSYRVAAETSFIAYALANVTHSYSTSAEWVPQFLDAYDRLTAKSAVALPPPPASLADLPLVEIRAATPGPPWP